MERQAKPGELEVVKAVEGVTRRNVESAILFGNDTRKMVRELRVMFDALQNNVIALHTQVGQLQQQLANLQQQFYSKGTVSYSDGD